MTEITPEKVAAALTDGSGEWWDSLEREVSLTAEGNVLSLELTWYDEDGKKDPSRARHFRAVVVEGETVPALLDRDEYEAGVVAAVDKLSRALLTSLKEEYPIHLALLRRDLFALGEAAQAKDGAE